tara:strand:+ start:632 stop:823 length:192 start_codon:yes stop_codon:yes gene_type:complete
MMHHKSDHDMITELHTAIVGANGKGGLIDQVKSNTKKINRLYLIVAGIFSGGGIVAWVKGLFN